MTTSSSSVPRAIRRVLREIAPSQPWTSTTKSRGKNSRVDNFIELDIANVQWWSGFTMSNIEDMYRDLLGQEIKCSEPTDPGTPSVINNISELNTVVLRWCIEVLHKPLEAGARFMQEKLGQHRQEIKIGGPPLGLMSTDLPRGVLPSWVVWKYGGWSGQTALVMGIMKRHTTWNSNLLRSDTFQDIEEGIWGLRHLATLCWSASTRYGFIVTEQELVAVRVSSGSSPRVAAIEYAACPWGAGVVPGDNNLPTINMAIWALAMMSVDDGNRHIIRKDMVPNIGSWDPIEYPENGRMHPLTKQFISTPLDLGGNFGAADGVGAAGGVGNLEDTLGVQGGWLDYNPDMRWP